MRNPVEVVWWCPQCGTENVDPSDTDVYGCAECHGEFTFQALEQVVIQVNAPAAPALAAEG